MTVKFNFTHSDRRLDCDGAVPADGRPVQPVVVRRGTPAADTVDASGPVDAKRTPAGESDRPVGVGRLLITVIGAPGGSRAYRVRTGESTADAKRAPAPKGGDHEQYRESAGDRLVSCDDVGRYRSHSS